MQLNTSSSPFVTSGVRFGTPACTTRGFTEEEFIVTGNLIADVLDGLKKSEENSKIEEEVYIKVRTLTSKFPIYQKHNL